MLNFFINYLHDVQVLRKSLKFNNKFNIDELRLMKNKLWESEYFISINVAQYQNTKKNLLRNLVKI